MPTEAENKALADYLTAVLGTAPKKPAKGKKLEKRTTTSSSSTGRKSTTDSMQRRQKSYVPLDPSVFGTASSLVSARQLPSQKELAEGILEYENALQGLRGNKPSQVDLSPLLALSDTWWGGNLSKGYSAPRDVYSKQEEMLLKGLQKARSQASMNYVQILQALLGKSGTDETRQGTEQTTGKTDVHTTTNVIQPQGFGKTGGGGGGEKETKEFERKSASFGSRMLRSHQATEALLSDPKFVKAATSKTYAAARKTKDIGGTFFMDEKERELINLEQDFITAVLRDESGAAIGSKEYEEKADYLFPRAGDSQAILRQKSLRRKQEIENMKLSAGRAWGQRTQVGNEGGTGAAPMTDPKAFLRSQSKKVKKK